MTNLFRRLKGIEHIADKRIARGKIAGDDIEIRAGNATKKAMQKAYKIVKDEICQCSDCVNFIKLGEEKERFFKERRDIFIDEEDLLEVWDEFENMCKSFGYGGICGLYDSERRLDEYCSRGKRNEQNGI